MAYFASWDTVPGGYSVDAPSNVLNALCIRHTGGDEYGRTLPTSIRAFDDYRPPLLIYVLALSSYLHPLTVKSARFLSMGLGWAALGAFLITPFPLSTAADQVGTLLPSALHFPALLTLDSGSASDAGGICQHPPGRPVPSADVLEMDSAARVPSSRCPRRPGDGADALRVLRNETSGLHSPPSPWRHTVLSAASLPTINVDLCGSLGTRGGADTVGHARGMAQPGSFRSCGDDRSSALAGGAAATRWP